VDGEYYVIKNVRIADMSYEEQLSAINEVKLMSRKYQERNYLVTDKYLCCSSIPYTMLFVLIAAIEMDNNNVVRYFDSFLTKESLHIVMEFCNKGDVQSLLKKAKSKGLNSLREPLIWNITLQIMLGMYYIHKKKILHRDLKTANVFLEKKSGSDHYCAKIGDLGVAKLLETSTAFAQTIIGTPYYLSPELCADQPYRDKSDCWALGVIVYECCTLDHPFDARNQCALILKIIQCPVPSMQPKHNISKPLERLVSWLLEKDPNQRPTIKALLCEVDCLLVACCLLHVWFVCLTVLSTVHYAVLVDNLIFVEVHPRAAAR
jgi:serine/threonine protein kinase